MKRYGLIGRSLSHSFSPRYFESKFEALGLKDHAYELFELDSIAEASALFAREDIKGLNVTIPYKEEVMALLDEIEPRAKEIGAVNTIAFRNGRSYGYNTDVIGFEQALLALIGAERPKALVFGTGGAAKTVHYVLKGLNIESCAVSRREGTDAINYEQVTEEHVRAHRLLINTTPVGMFPKAEELLPLPYAAVGVEHFALDLIYNPDRTKFLAACEEQGAQIKSGLKMLELQADAAWEIWDANY